MSAKKKFALMHIEAMKKGKATSNLFGYLIAMNYQEKDIRVEIYGKRAEPKLTEIEYLVRSFLLFSAPVSREETLTGISLTSKRADVFSLSRF